MTRMVSLAEEASNIISGITSISPWKVPLFPQNSINSKFSSPATKSFSWITTMSSWTYPSSSSSLTRHTDWKIKMPKFCQLWKDCPVKGFCSWLERPFKTILDSFGACLIIFILKSLAPTKISEDRLETYLRMSKLKNWIVFWSLICFEGWRKMSNNPFHHFRKQSSTLKWLIYKKQSTRLYMKRIRICSSKV